MTYRDKTPAVVSILVRKLKEGKTFADFQKAHIPAGAVEETEFGYDVDFFSVPTRVINAVSCQDPSVIYSIGLSYGRVEEIFAEVQAKMQEERQPGARVELLDEICDDLAPPALAFVATDNNYGGGNPEFQQTPLAEVTPEITAAIRAVFNHE